MTTEYSSPPHLHDGTTVTGLMAKVGLALVPGLLIYLWWFGSGILIQCLLAVSAALLCEWLLLRVTGKPAMYLKDGSVIVTALLFAFSLSPFTPWWITVLGISFAVVFAKHLYGGLGYNLFNPAMAGYVFILLCFPAQLNQWPSVGVTPDFSDYLAIIFSGHMSTGIDALSGASPLNHMKSQLNNMAMIPEIISNPIYGTIGGRGWEIINTAFLAGGLWLLFSRTIRWHIPAAVLGGLFGCSLCLYISDSAIHVAPFFHLFSGGTMLGAFFIATDPVTAPTTALGRVLYGVLIGIVVFAIRTWGGYPDGFAFAVLIANMFAPLISHYTTPPVMGQEHL
ncbi:MAG: Ion-translocating oxidoreductase complex subunit D [Gammaproteobacteria bacterium]|nr:Ion-translocating oxidoreductase complex subunit D [Gammaproteobacteria bacterium]